MDDVKLEALFQHALQIESPTDRNDYLDSACGDDQELREEIERLLQCHRDADAGQFLEPAARASEARLATGTLLANQYTIRRLIGEGSFGAVYKAENPGGQIVAVKVLYNATPPEAVQRFAREAARLKRVHHQNIVEYLDSGDDAGLSYLVMEYVVGTTLSRITSGEDHILLVSTKIASGLQALHQQAIIHRDIKPRNVIKSVDFSTVKIVDLGIARCTLDDTLTKQEEIIGTPKYLSPEQAARKEVDERSDLFSLGAVMYFLVTSESPFEGSQAEADSRAVLRNVLQKQVTPLAESHGTSQALSDIISRLLQKDPNDRFQNAASLISALQGVREQTPTRLRAHPMADSSSRTWKRTLLETAKSHQPIYVVRSQASHKMKGQIEQSLAASNSVDQKFLYFDIAAVDKWTKIINADTYGVYHRCFGVCKTLCEKSDWIEILTSHDAIRFVDLGVGTGDKDNWLIHNACQANDNVELILLDSSFPMLELTIEQLDDDINRFSKVRAVKGDFYCLRESIQQYLDSDPGTRTRNVFLLLGGTFSNLEEDSFLTEIKKVLCPDDILVLQVECFDDPTPMRNALVREYDNPEVKSLAALSVRYIAPELSESEIVKDISVHVTGRRGLSSVPSAMSAEVCWNQDRRLSIRLVKISRYRKPYLLDFIRNHGFELRFEVEESVKVCPASTVSYLILGPALPDTDVGI